MEPPILPEAPLMPWPVRRERTNLQGQLTFCRDHQRHRDVGETHPRHGAQRHRARDQLRAGQS